MAVLLGVIIEYLIKKVMHEKKEIKSLKVGKYHFKQKV